MRLAILLLAGVCASAQAPAVPQDRTARLEGIVLADANGLPLRRVQVILRPLEAGKPALGTQTDERGTFSLRDIPPGGYQLSAERDGYLTTTTFRRGPLRMPPRFTLSAGENITGLSFRLRPWSVIGGRIRYEDGDPAVNVRVELYRQYHLRGRRGFSRVASAQTDDRGEYRAHGLAPGAYYVAAAFEGDQTGPGVQDQPRIDRYGREVPVPTYTTIFFPNTMKLSEASPLRLKEGDELTGIDLYLRPVERRKLSGRITEGVSGSTITSAALTMERLDSGNNGTLPVPIQLTFDEDDQFHIDNVAPGSYQLWLDASFENQRLLGRANLLVTNSDINDLELFAAPARPWMGEVIVADGSAPLPRAYSPYVVLEPRSERGAVLIPDVQNRAFELTMAPGETYDLFVNNLPDGFYISEVRARGTDVRAAGLRADMASNLPFQVVLKSDGGRIAGLVTGAGTGPAAEVWSGATVALIPDPPRDRLQYYHEVFANEYGEFRIEGIAPGRYTLTAWLDQPVCEVYDEEALDACRLSGMPVTIEDAALQEVALQIKAIPGR